MIHRTYSFRSALALTAAILTASAVHAQQLQTITSLPLEVSETSGLEINSETVWTFNDSGGEAKLYECDTLGNLLRSVQINGAWNRDWEELAQDDQGNFYIGNFGNNNNANTDLTIFKIPNPENAVNNAVTAEVIYFSYEDQTAFPPGQTDLNFDCEAMFWFDNNLYLCSKNRTVPFDGMTYLYRLPDSPGSYSALNIGAFDTEGYDTFDYWITAADINPSGTIVTLLSSNKMWAFYDFQGDAFFDGSNQRINFPSSTQKEAIVFKNDEEVYITDEDWGDIGRNLYRLNVADAIQPIVQDPHIVPGLIEAEDYDLGGNGIGYYDLYAGNQGGAYRNDDVDIEATQDQTGEFNVGWFEPGEWLQYTVDAQYDGDYTLSLRNASQLDATFYIEVDEVKIGESHAVSPSGDWQLWQSFEVADVPIAAGEHTVRIVMESGGFNLNNINFEVLITSQLAAVENNQFSIYPNPTEGLLYLNGSTEMSFQVLAPTGQTVASFAPTKAQVVDLSELTPGLYIVRAISENSIQHQSVIVE